MFQQPLEKKRSPFWKFLPVGLAVFAILVAAAVYLSQRDDQSQEELQGVLRKGDPTFDWYHRYVELVDPKIQMGLNFAGNRVLMLSGTIKNGGEKTLDVVEVKVVFFNYDQPIFETERVPIRPGPYTPAIPPLTDRSFTFYIEKIPEGWLSSHAEMSIHGLRFETRTP